METSCLPFNLDRRQRSKECMDTNFRLKRQVSNRFLGISLFFLLISLPVSLLRLPATGFHAGIISHLLSVIFLGILFAVKERLTPDIVFQASMTIFMVLIPVGFIHLGPLSANLLLSVFIPIFLRIVYGRRAATFGLVYCLLAIGVFGTLFGTKLLNIGCDVAGLIHSPGFWLYYICNYFLGLTMFFAVYTPAEQRVMGKQAWFNAIFDAVNDAILIRDADTDAMLDINKRFSVLFGYSREEVASLPLAFLDAADTPETRAANAEQIRKHLQAGYFCFDHWPVRCKDGTILIVEGELRRLRLEDADVVITAFRDVTIRKKAEDALRESENKYRQVFEMESDALFLIDKDSGRILEVNSAACSMYGFSREELLQKKNTDLSAEPSKTTHQTQTEGTLIPIRYHKKADGSVFPVEITAGHFSLNDRRVHLAAIRDISFRLKLEEQLLQAKKMESIGRLAGGISHDFNNLLSPIMGFSELMLKCETVDPHHRDWLKSIRKAAERARDLTRQLLAFGRKQVLLLKPVSLEAVLKEIEQILRRTIREDIHIEIEIQPRVGVVKADIGQIEQILMNLALNAQDAMPKGGTLRISLSETMFRPIGSDESGDIPEKPHAMLTINDTGCGMSPDVIQHLFEPFFTTKEKGKGTGLGLSMVYGIVKQHGGHILADSASGVGTTFMIYLPVIANVAEHVGETLESATTSSGGTETIMVVEDDEMVRNMIRQILTHHGYKVITAGSGPDCLAMMERNEPTFDLLLTDVIMPGMNGKQLYEKLCERISPLKVMFISGYDPNVIAKHGVLDEHLHFLQKPFTPDQLCAKIRQAIVGV